MGRNPLITEGEIFLITHGEYSDYHPTDLMRCLKDFNIDDYWAPGRFDPEVDKACAQMVSDGVAEPIIYREFNGSYTSRGKWDVY